MAEVISEFKLKGGKPTIKKDQNSGLIYGVNMAPWLAAGGGLTLDPSKLTIRESKGVTVGVPFIQDDILCVMVNGLDTSDEADNYVTFHFYCTDGQHDDRTIYFEKTDN